MTNFLKIVKTISHGIFLITNVAVMTIVTSLCDYRIYLPIILGPDGLTAVASR